MFKLNNIFSFLKSSTNQLQSEQIQDGSSLTQNQANNSQPNNNQVNSGQVNNGVPNALKVTQNWFEERSDKIIVQRNLLMILLLILTAFMIVATLVIAFVVKSKQFDPFVIQLDDDTGRAAVVNPLSSSLLIADESLTRYFIKKYLVARETYNPVDFATTARTTVRLFSTTSVYYNYLGYIRNKDIDPSLKYKQDNTTFLIIKSWSKISQNNYIIRFSINETSGNQQVFNKISVINIDYVPMELTDTELDINPVGFQVNGYRVDDDNS